MLKVAVICLCYNHENYVQETLDSVLAQTYRNWELIVVDDASNDNSKQQIEQFISAHPDSRISTLFLNENMGNCRAFNKALALTEAEYIIDLAADDILLPERLELGLANMEKSPEVAINFSNANYIDESGKLLHSHYPIDQWGKSTIPVPEGIVFRNIIERYFICSPTMMYRAIFLKKAGGYDENLAYEDFDIKIRLSRVYPFSYTDKILVRKRILNTAMSQKQYKKGNFQLYSTLIICRKIFCMIRGKAEKYALLKRLAFEAKQALIFRRLFLFLKFSSLWFKTLLMK
ncbi:glycosyltransferase [Marivirga sp. S37H4]|uniref:Glycosyltransferase n=1 Tax=Marivirga aurantiaca TaxID=2802615 RepID=A0A934WVR7_9BACT|nr:glycosyltransferase [Marivirga aurantiaca]MBK6263821.1 glycosyltransferase [Marivirga aurantiaca]